MSMESSLTLNPLVASRGSHAYKENMKAWINLHTHNRYHEDTVKEFVSIKDVLFPRA